MAKYALHRLRHPQEDDQLLHEGPAGEGAARGHGGGATMQDLDAWMNSLLQPWTIAMEATMFTS